MAAYDATGLVARTLEKYAKRYGGNAVGAALIIFSSLTMAAMMGAVKDLSATYTVWQIVLIRTSGQLIVLLPLIVRSHGDLLKSQRLDLQLLRCGLAFFAITAWFYSIGHIPLAEASAISFSRTVFLVGLAAVVFSERVGLVGWSATGIGMFGVVLILDPTAEALNHAAIIGVGGAIVTAGVATIVKKLTMTDSTATIMCYPAITHTVLCGIPSFFFWVPITWEFVPLFALALAGGVVSQWCFISAYRHGEASVMATLEYSRLIAAAIIGYVIFAEVPTSMSFAGIILIIAATIVAMRRDRIGKWLAR